MEYSHMIQGAKAQCGRGTGFQKRAVKCLGLRVFDSGSLS